MKYDGAAMVTRCMRGQQPYLFSSGYIEEYGWMPSLVEVTGRGDPHPPSEIHLPAIDHGLDGAIPIPVDISQEVCNTSTLQDPASAPPQGVFYYD